MRSYCLRHGRGLIRGEIVSFPVSPRYPNLLCYYMVLTTRPTSIVWLPLPLGDPQRPSYGMVRVITRLTTEDIKRLVLERQVTT